jgi:hypothetical protein
METDTQRLISGFETPKSYRHCISLFSASSSISGSVNGENRNDLAPSSSKKLTGSVFQLPSVPPNTCSNF